MRPLQSDPTVLEPWGPAWLGLVIPGAVLLVSVALSLYLYWRFARKPAGP